jgi:hypothetical protein
MNRMGGALEAGLSFEGVSGSETFDGYPVHAAR